MARRPEPTAAERAGYLQALREGQPRPVAARSVNKQLTGSIFRALIHADPVFAQEVAEAEAEGQQEYRDLLQAQVQRRALRVEEKTTKALEIALATEMPEKYGWLKRNGGSSNEGDPLALTVNPDLLTSAQIEQLVLLVEYGQGKRPNPELQAEIAQRKQLDGGHPVIEQ